MGDIALCDPLSNFYDTLLSFEDICNQVAKFKKDAKFVNKIFMRLPAYQDTPF